MKAGWTERERTKRVGGKQEKVDQKNNRDRDRQAGWEAGKTERKRGKRGRDRLQYTLRRITLLFY